MEECITHFSLLDSVIWGIALFDTTVAFFEVMSDTFTLSCFVVVVVVVCVETRVGQQPATEAPTSHTSNVRTVVPTWCMYQCQLPNS